MKGRRYKYIYIFLFIKIHRYFRNAILKSVIVREKEVHGKYLYSHERGLVDRIISHRGKEGSVVSQRVSHWDLSLKKERKERKTIDFHFFPPLLFHFRSSSFSRPFSQGFIKNFSRFEDQTSEECVESIFRFLFSLSRIAWITLLITTMIFFIHTKRKAEKIFLNLLLNRCIFVDRQNGKYWLLDSRIIISDTWQFRSNFLLYPNVIVRSRWHEQRLVS